MTVESVCARVCVRVRVCVFRYAFGTMIVFGEEKPFSIEGCWLIRGTSIAPLLECNPDAEYYTWTKVNVEDEAQRVLVRHGQRYSRAPSHIPRFAPSVSVPSLPLR